MLLIQMSSGLSCCRLPEKYLYLWICGQRRQAFFHLWGYWVIGFRKTGSGNVFSFHLNMYRDLIQETTWLGLCMNVLDKFQISRRVRMTLFCYFYFSRQLDPRHVRHRSSQLQVTMLAAMTPCCEVWPVGWQSKLLRMTKQLSLSMLMTTILAV